ncbi:CatB-related O-acetyltransferase [Rhodovulum sp. DZ06]|uniref:CatB-related O-acetyltransferase n=1 Tax=Rhodovulum sp. DZ06 TaxID=3425126 RepID=UPI003D33F1B4
MARPFLDAAARHPIMLPTGDEHPNVVHLSRVIDHPNWQVGDHAYASDFGAVADWAAHLAPYLHPGAPERLRIGRFCAVAHGVRFITASANHPMGGISTYPFAIFRPETMGAYAEEVGARGDTELGPDVWLGDGATVMPGVRIGAGAIVAARAVVTRDVPDYAVVAGNPARVVRMRFAPGEVAALLRVRWWDRPVDWIEAQQGAMRAGDVAALEAAAREAGWVD